MTASTRTCGNPVCRAQVLPLLAQLGALISGSADLKKTLAILLQIMERQMGVVRGMVTLYHRRTGKIFVHESLGLTDEEAARGVYLLGEGITGKVVELGRLLVVRDIRTEPAFLNRTRAPGDRRGPFVRVRAHSAGAQGARDHQRRAPLRHPRAFGTRR